jgi:hypothetical protein
MQVLGQIWPLSAGADSMGPARLPELPQSRRGPSPGWAGALQAPARPEFCSNPGSPRLGQHAASPGWAGKAGWAGVRRALAGPAVQVNPGWAGVQQAPAGPVQANPGLGLHWKPG